MTTKNEIEKRESEIEQGNSPADMIRMAVSGGADLEKLEKLLAIQTQWEEREAKKAYHKAMSDFKANPPQIFKEKSADYGSGKAKYNYASLANVCEKINESLSKHGLSASWKVSQNGVVTVTCRITHEKGHSEDTTLSAPADTSGSKNQIQAIGSTITYLQRYTLLALCGLATEDQDDDAKNIGVEFIDEQQIGTIRDYMLSTATDEARFLKYMGIEELEKMPKADYQKALQALKAKGAKK